MHALVGVFNMDASRHAEQRAELKDRIIPMCQTLPGFVSGYWSYDPATFQHFSHLVFETKEPAEQLAGMIGGDTERQRSAGVAVVSLKVVEVLGSAARR